MASILIGKLPLKILAFIKYKGDKVAINSFHEQLRRIVLSGIIKEDTGAQFLEQMTALEYIDHTKPITIYIDTYGGSVDAALLMYDCIRTSSCPVNTVGMGKVMSAGVLLLAAGDKGYRFVSPNTRVMIHEISGGSIGTVSEMETSVTEIKRMQDIYTSLLAKHAEVNKAKVLEDMQKVSYMSAKQAINYGIADKLFPSRKVATRKPVEKRKTRNKKKG